MIVYFALNEALIHFLQIWGDLIYRETKMEDFECEIAKFEPSVLADDERRKLEIQINMKKNSSSFPNKIVYLFLYSPKHSNVLFAFGLGIFYFPLLLLYLLFLILMGLGLFDVNSILMFSFFGILHFWVCGHIDGRQGFSK